MGQSERFEPTPEQRAMIERKIAAYIVAESFEEARQAAARSHALPLYLDWSGCLALRPDGQMLCIDYDESEPTRVVEDERERNLGLFQGARRDSELRWLIPPRPLDATSCPDCRGTGKLAFPEGYENLAERLICSCGGIGWLPAQVERHDNRKKSLRRPIVLTLLLVVAIPSTLLGLSLLGAFPWSGVNCSQSDIDLSSGRIRHMRYMLWVPVRRTVRDSALTKAISPEERSKVSPDWHPVVTSSPGLRHSPHYYYHGAHNQIRELEIAWKWGKMTPAARGETARNVLRLWREAGSDSLAKKYIDAVWEKAEAAEKREEAIDVDSLPTRRLPKDR